MSKPIALFVELQIADKFKYVSELTEKFYNNNLSVAVYVTQNSDLSKLDTFLWTWKKESFIPHMIFTGGENINNEVLLCSQEDTLPQTDVLIMFDPVPVEKLHNYKMSIDFAETYHAEKKIESRKRYKILRDSDQFQLSFTKLGAILAKQEIKLASINS